MVGLLKEQYSNEKESLISGAEDMETALARIESIKDTRGTAVLTDMFMPEKKNSFNPTEGLKVIQEILEFYGVNPEVANKRVEQVKQVLGRYGDNIESIARSDYGGGYSAKGENIGREIRKAFGDLDSDPELLNFSNTILGKKGNLYSIYSKYRYPPDFLKGKSEEELINFGVLVEKNEELDLSENFIQEHQEELRDNIVNGRGFINDISYALLWGKDGGLPLGIRVAEEAHKKQIPCIVVSGGHGVQIPNSMVFAQYLHKKGIINNPYALGINDIDLKSPNIQNIINQHSYFIMSKKITGTDEEIKNYGDMFKKNKDTINAIVKSLRSRA